MRTHNLLRAALSMVALSGMLGVSVGLAQADGDEHRARHGHGKRGALFVMTNATDAHRGNEIAMYQRAANGDLSLIGYFPTGVLDQSDPQLGSGPAPTAQVFQRVDARLPLVVAAADGLGSSNSLMLSDDKRCLFAVNAGSNSVSSFRVRDAGLTLVSVMQSRGVFPASLSHHGDLLYVLNAGDASVSPVNPGSLAGFRVSHCALQPLNSPAVSLAGLTDSFPIPAPSEVLTTPAQVSFTPDGRRLVLSIKGGDAVVAGGRLQALPSGRMVVYSVTADGHLGAPTVTRFNALSSGAMANTGGPFSFVFADAQTLIVVHANSGTVGSYTIDAANRLSLTRNLPPLSTGAFAPCWLDSNGRFVFTASIGAPSGVRQILGEGAGLPDLNGLLTGFRVKHDGTLAPTGVSVNYPAPPAGTTGNHAIDVRVVGDFLYFIQPRTGRVGRLTIGPNGELSDMQHYGGLTPGLEPFAGINPGINHFLDRCYLQDPASVSPECLRGSAQGIAGF
jgi:hypothetical protein